MNRHHALLFTTVIFSGAFACVQDDTLSSAELNATYAAAATQGGEADTAGVPDDTAVPQEGDAEAGDDETNLHRDCSLDAVHDRVMQNADTDGDGTISEEERAALEARFGERGPPGRHGPRGEGMGGEGPGGEGMAGGPGGGPGGRGHHGPMGFRRLMWIYDADDSGELDEAERAILEADLEARGAAIEARTLAEFDADADGLLSDAELEAARSAHRAAQEARRAAELVTYDTDGDGRLSREEMRAKHDAKRAGLEAEYDLDASGDLDATEKAALREYLRSVVRGEVQP
jgi:hypothetical protein